MTAYRRGVAAEQRGQRQLAQARAAEAASEAAQAAAVSLEIDTLSTPSA